MKFSGWQLFRQGLSGHKDWPEHWTSKEKPEKSYDTVIIGGGGHGLATAYYLAKYWDVGSIAVLEKNWLGGGNTGRNTTIIRSNYLFPESLRLFDHAIGLWEGLSKELNYNVMFSQRGVLYISHDEHDLRETNRRWHAIRASGVDSVYMSPAEIKELVPIINLNTRFPILGGVFQPRGGVARHDAVAWGYARAATKLGVDIIENCEVTAFDIKKGKVETLITSKGNIKVGKVGMVTAGSSALMAMKAGFRLPLIINTLQAAVSEPVKPLINTVVMSNGVHGYLSQSDKGELVLGGGTDMPVSYSQRGEYPWLEESMSAFVELYPCLSRLRVLRIWGGTVDVTKDRSPILSTTPVDNLYVNCGWGTGGFKATPGSGHVFADLVARGEPNHLAQPFSMFRFGQGRLVDEGAAAGVAH